MGKAQHEAEIANIKAKIADAEQKQQKAKNDINSYNNKIVNLEEENKTSKKAQAAMSADVFAKEKSLEVLKRKESVLKAFLSGPLLEMGGDTASEETEAPEEVAPTEETEAPEEVAPTEETEYGYGGDEAPAKRKVRLMESAGPVKAAPKKDPLGLPELQKLKPLPLGILNEEA